MTDIPVLYSYADAAPRLGKTETWLRRHVRELPHLKIGKTVRFTDEHLAAILRASEVTPPAYLPKAEQLRPVTRRRALRP